MSFSFGKDNYFHWLENSGLTGLGCGCLVLFISFWVVKISHSTNFWFAWFLRRVYYHSSLCSSVRGIMSHLHPWLWLPQRFYFIIILISVFYLLFFLFLFIFISWRLITLQYCSGFCHTLTRIRADFWTLWEKARVGCFERTASKHAYYLKILFLTSAFEKMRSVCVCI